MYPNRPDLKDLVLYQCPCCKNPVGTHKNSGKPLGIIVSKEIKALRIKIHAILDPMWKGGGYKRKELYMKLSEKIGEDFHVANITTQEQAERVLKLIENMQSVQFHDVDAETKEQAGELML